MSQRFQMKRLPLALAAVLPAGCNFTAFDDYADKAPIRVSSAPSAFRGNGFGQVVTTFRTGDDDERSVVVSSAGRNTSVVFERMWSGEKITDATFTRCKEAKDCKDSTGLGGALIPFGHWALGTQQEESGCVFAPAQPKAYVFCDSDTAANQSFALDVGEVDTGQQVYFSGAGLGDGHPLGVLILGSYWVSDRSGEASHGRLFRQPDFQPPGAPSDDDVVPPLEEVELLDPETGESFAEQNDDDAGDLGYALSVYELSDGDVWLAVAQPSLDRVIVARYSADAESWTTHACVESPDSRAQGFGKHLVFGDINADDQPELIIGTDATDSAEQVWLYRGAGLPAAAPDGEPCPGWGNEPIEVRCDEGIHGVRCADSAFGASVALGDVDGDGYSDLLVGAPNAKVGDVDEAGAVWLFPGGRDTPGDGGLDLESGTNLSLGTKAQARVGTSVATLHTRERDEPVVGAPGEERVYTFMCSDLESDVADRDLCLPK